MANLGERQLRAADRPSPVAFARAVALAAVVALSGLASGCDRTPASVREAESAVKALLNDPDSVRFSAMRYNPKDGSVCGMYTAKNSFGGYVASRLFAYNGPGKLYAQRDRDQTMSEQVLMLRVCQSPDLVVVER